MKDNTKPLHLDDATARRIYPGAAKELKEILEQNWPKGFFSLSLKDRIKTWEDCAEELGIDPVRSLPYPNPKPNMDDEFGESDEKAQNAFFKLTKIHRLFKAGTVLDYTDTNQPKWYAWFKHTGKKAAGFAFSSSHTLYVFSNTAVGPRLSNTTDENIRYITTQFSDLYNDLYNEYKTQG